ncbi:MAG: hypothetical protein JXJ04_22060 [Spirochaetales bacterium]|nr:hypothetical protein [Spirochaetales bacterium]
MIRTPEKFLNLIKDEVVPFVENKFSCDPDRRILFGHSYGGSFLVYAFTSGIIEQDRTFTDLSVPALFFKSQRQWA